MARQGSCKPQLFLDFSLYCLINGGFWDYSQAIYEGTKAYRNENGKLLLFRPDHNAIRMKLGAERMLMPSPSVDQFVNAVKQTALANKRWVKIVFL